MATSSLATDGPHPFGETSAPLEPVRGTNKRHPDSPASEEETAVQSVTDSNQAQVIQDVVKKQTEEFTLCDFYSI